MRTASDDMTSSAPQSPDPLPLAGEVVSSGSTIEIRRGLLSAAEVHSLLQIANNPLYAERFAAGRRLSGYLCLAVDHLFQYDVAGVFEFVGRAFNALEAGTIDVARSDALFLLFGTGAGIPEHVDDDHLESGHQHWRCNILLERAAEGGELVIADQPIDLRPGDAVLFRSDCERHRVSPVTRGRRLVFTVGALL